MFHQLKRFAVALAFAFGGLAASAQAQEVFFGEDQGTNDNLVPRANTPNADAARDEFFARLQTGGTGTEDFEGFTDGDASPLIVDFTVLTATLQGSGFIEDVPMGTTNGDGRYPTSGTKYWDSDRNFTITFSTPIQAVGFYGIDMGDFAGQLSVTYDDGSLVTVDIPHTLNGPTGSVIYFGLVTPVAFSAISFLNSDPGDVFGFDDFTVQVFVEDIPPIPPPEVPVPTNVPVDSPWALALLIGLMGLIGTAVLRRA